MYSMRAPCMHAWLHHSLQRALQVAEAHKNNALATACIAFAAQPALLAKLWSDAQFLQVGPVIIPCH